ncbi:uncharacterized protein EV154DRAFT_69463 [Mucor mucedo]|uniref:uncharacterized protein n=1 Tax=Mucor mucedo TaxID=29922 RepID=UPI00221F7B26|nr:uncharacterized protein EV154DRAFT_69463 [Mucor mucedo]KAI7894682.1 hypothetical protein EV154DRAFT_69463 [Mucor mucedo]
MTKVRLSADKANIHFRLFLHGSCDVSRYIFNEILTSDEEIWEYCSTFTKSELFKISLGAVYSIVNTYKSQTPFFLYDEHRPLFPDSRLSSPETVSEESIDDNGENGAYDFIIGIDFGTTFSGCSYVQLKDKSGIPVDTREIKTIKTGWPGGNLNKFGKTPTILTYDGDMNLKYWGEKARLESKRRKDLDLLGNFKLFLCPKSSENFYDRTDNLEELKGQGGFVDNRTPKNVLDVIKIIADYLNLFINHVIEAGLLKKYKIKYVMTVPAMWNSEARDSMACTAMAAGLVKKKDLDQLLIISEPEAAALFCMKRMTEYFKKEDEELNDTNFIVCDAGGGTAELVTFNLQLNKEEGDTSSTEPTIRQIGDYIGDICGSTCLDVRFKNYLHEFYKSFGVDIDEENVPLDDVIQEFVKNYKLDFMPSSQGDSYYDINLPEKGIVDFTENSTYKLANGNRTLKMKNQDMKEKIFDPVVDRILYLIDDQLNQAKKLDKRIDAILMIGGFSQSPYLQQRIKDRYKNVCHVGFPTESVEAISHGAVSYALNPYTILGKTATQSFGLEVQAPFDKILAVSSKRRVKGPNGDWNFEKDRIEYFVKRGQLLKGEQQTVYQKDVYVLYPNAAVICTYIHCK